MVMTIVSDNVATALLLFEFGGRDAVNTTAADLGLTTARLASFEEMWAGAPFGSATARDLAEAYSHLGQRNKENLFAGGIAQDSRDDWRMTPTPRTTI